MSNIEFVAPAINGTTSAGATICSVCSTPIGPRTKSGLCRVHARTHGTPNPYPRIANCKSCGCGITAQAKSGYCKSCANRIRNSTPEFRAKVSAGQRRLMSDPDFAEKKRRIAIRNVQKAMLDPQKRERARELAMEHLALAFTPEAIARKEAMLKEKGRRVSETRMAWCPPEFRDLHRKNIRSRRMSLAQSQAMIAELAQERRAINHPSWQSVLDYMRRLTSVVLLNNGNYRVGLAELTPGQLLQRAEVKGYELPRWAA